MSFARDNSGCKERKQRITKWKSLAHTGTRTHDPWFSGIVHENYATGKFEFMCLLMRLLSLLPAGHLLPFYWLAMRANKKIWIHIKHCLSSAKAMPIQKTLNLICGGVAASDAHNLCYLCCLASLADFIFFFKNFCSEISWTTLQDVNNLQIRKKRLFYLDVYTILNRI